MPLTGSEIIQLRKNRAEQIVALHVMRIRAQGGARHLLRIGATAIAEEQHREIVESPIRLRRDRDDGAESFGGLCYVAAARVNKISKLQSVDIASVAPQALLRSGTRCGQIIARERFASTLN